MMGWRFLISGLVLVSVSTVSAAAFGQLAGRLSFSHYCLGLALGVFAASLAARRASAPKQGITFPDIVLFTVFALASLRAFLWLVFPHNDEIFVLSPHNLGDMALHLNLIHRWGTDGAFWPENPFLANAIFPYHPGMDIWNAMLFRFGVPVFQGLKIVGLLGAAAAAYALWRWGRSFALAGFLFAGGLSIFTFFSSGSVDAMQEHLAWKNPFLTMFVTQRGWLFSLPAGLALLSMWRTQLSDDSGPTAPPLTQAALYASMPLFNAPAFIFLSAALALFTLFAIPKNKAKPFVILGLVSLIPAAWLVRLVTANFSASTAFRFAPGWMPEGSHFGFWMLNFGVFLPLVVWLGFQLLRHPGNTPSIAFYILGTGTLVFCFLFNIAPWAWDNTKLILWGYLALLPFLWDRVLLPSPLWLRSLLCLLLFSSGAVALAVGLDGRHGYKLASRAELADAAFLLRSLSPNARVACAPGFDHPAMLLGHPVVMGYDGHLFSQGLDYTPTQNQLDHLMNGESDWKNAARTLRAYYLFWGPREALRWQASSQPWRSCAKPIASTESGTLYLLTPCLLSDED